MGMFNCFITGTDSRSHGIKGKSSKAGSLGVTLKFSSTCNTQKDIIRFSNKSLFCIHKRVTVVLLFTKSFSQSRQVCKFFSNQINPLQFHSCKLFRAKIQLKKKNKPRRKGDFIHLINNPKGL